MKYDGTRRIVTSLLLASGLIAQAPVGVVQFGALYCAAVQRSATQVQTYCYLFPAAPAWVEVVGKKKKWRGNYYTFDRAGKRKHHTADLGPKADRTKGEAEDALRTVIQRETKIVSPATGENTLEWFWTNRFVPMQTWEPQTAGSLGCVFKRHVFPAIGATPLADLDRYQIQMVIQDAAREFSKSVVKKIRCYLKACLEEAIEQDIIAKNPMRKLPFPDLKPECRRYLSIDEIHALLEAMGARDRLICRILLICGLRPGELFGAKWDDFDAAAGRLRIDEAAVEGRMKATKTVASRAYVWVPPVIVESLKAWRETQSAAFIFPGGSGGPMITHNFLRRHIYPAAIRAGIMQPRPKKLAKGARWVDKQTGVNFQAFRRTCATWIQKHAGAKDIQAHLRHATPDMTMGVYVQEIPKSVSIAVGRLDAELFGQPAKPTPPEKVN